MSSIVSLAVLQLMDSDLVRDRVGGINFLPLFVKLELSDNFGSGWGNISFAVRLACLGPSLCSARHPWEQYRPP